MKIPSILSVFKRIVWFLSLGMVLSLSQLEADERPPNVIVILTDDQGWGDLSLNGNSNIETPSIDRLADEGCIFENFYVCAVCSPTRAEFLSGRYHFRSGVFSTGGGGERMNLDETTIADVFKKAGYATAAYGKWHNGMQYPYHPNARGFDDFYGFCSGHWGHYFSPMLEHNGKIVKGEGFVIDDFTNHGIEFMETHKDVPFFLYLPFNTPHTPFQAPEKNWENFKDKPLEMLGCNGEESLTETRAALAMCENIDENVERIVEKTKELGIADNTILLFFSDNGPNTHRWNGGMKGKKGGTDEGGVRSPLIMKWPNGIEAGTRITRLASVIDLLPTLTDMCGIEWDTQKPLDGMSLKPSICGGSSDRWEDRFIFNNWREKTSIRNQRFRLGEDEGLYEISVDREQKKDVSEQFPEVKRKMQAYASSLFQEKEQTLPKVDERPFYIGHPGMKYTQIPARDGTAHGRIKRSNRWPNCSFFENWIDAEDYISWDVNVPVGGEFNVRLYYTCPVGDEGSVIQLSLGDNKLVATLSEPHDPPLVGEAEDLAPREESYVKDWHILDMGTLHLDADSGTMTLKALEMPASSVMDFRLLQFERM